MASGRLSKHSEIKTEDLNLVPVMNLVTILIPFLLLSVQFVHLAVIDSSLPAIGAPQPMEQMEEPDKPPLTLTVAISPAGFTVSGGAATLPMMEGANLGEDAPEGQPTLPVMAAADFQAMCMSGEIDPFYFDMAKCFMQRSGKCAPRQELGGSAACTDMANATEYQWHKLGELIGMIKDEYPEDENVILLPESTTLYNDLVHLMDVTRQRAGSGGEEDEENVLFPNAVIAGGMQG